MVDLEDATVGFDNLRAWLVFNIIKYMIPQGKELWIRPDKWAKKFNCNVATMRKTIKNLIDNGCLEHRYYHPTEIRSKKYRLVKIAKHLREQNR